MSVEEAIAKSFQIAKMGNSENICSELESLNLKTLTSMLQQAKETGDMKQIVRKIGIVFSSDSLNVSFLQVEPTPLSFLLTFVEVLN
jgi:hypothetical protein